MIFLSIFFKWFRNQINKLVSENHPIHQLNQIMDGVDSLSLTVSFYDAVREENTRKIRFLMKNRILEKLDINANFIYKGTIITSLNRNCVKSLREILQHVQVIEDYYLLLHGAFTYNVTSIECMELIANVDVNKIPNFKPDQNLTALIGPSKKSPQINVEKLRIVIQSGKVDNTMLVNRLFFMNRYDLLRELINHEKCLYEILKAVAQSDLDKILTQVDEKNDDQMFVISTIFTSDQLQDYLGTPAVYEL